MSDLLKKGFYTGLGAGLLLKDEIMNALTPPVKVDDMPLEEVREQLRQVLARMAGGVGQGVDALKEAGEEELASLLDRFGLAKAEDVEALKKRIADLEATLKTGKKK
ncbi:MAG: phasin family protein [Desulfovibrio sp.]|jgi:polyhydroxyalkanoate synthesis regulator phasin|nr:phasin family protein [Desulfovibrio sp.]MBI4959946.1 phasin family protein [Desulfovibrio sp.]